MAEWLHAAYGIDVPICNVPERVPEMLASHPASLILLDAGFPERTSDRILQVLNQGSSPPDPTPVIVLDPTCTPARRSLWIAHGAHACATLDTLAEVLADHGLSALPK